LLFAGNDVTLIFVSMTRTIDPNTTMAELLEEYPGAQRALFRAYHIGGCASCGFSPGETLASVCQRNENLPVEKVIETILAGYEADQKMQLSPEEVAERLNSGKETHLIDVRSREEWDAVHIEGSTFFTQELMNEMMSEWPKDREIIFVCHHGIRSLDAAAFFGGHGFENARSMTGGIDSWSLRVDPGLPRYHVE
jgi:rhodanese-related sulfurtransferase